MHPSIRHQEIHSPQTLLFIKIRAAKCKAIEVIGQLCEISQVRWNRVEFNEWIECLMADGAFLHAVIFPFV